MELKSVYHFCNTQLPYPRENKPTLSARSLGLLGDWAFNRERRVFIQIYAHPQPQIEVYTLLYDNSLLVFSF